MISDLPITPSWLVDSKAPAGTAKAAPVQGETELRKLASDFESLFSKMLLSSMRKTVQQNPLFHAGRGEEVFSDLLDTHYAEALSKKDKGLGIADIIVRKYAAHVKAMEDQKGRKLDTGAASAVRGAGPGASPGAVEAAGEGHPHD